MKIFFSYPHDANAPLVERIKADLEARGHEVWFDADQIKSGDDWRNAITRGILESQQVVAFLSSHAVRDPGVCLNEIAIALADKGEAMVTVLVEPETQVNAPVSITHIQWLRMEDWKNQTQDDGWYRTQLGSLIDAIENPSHAGRNAELETLRLALDPMSFYAEIAPHIPGFTGRRWLIDRYNTWLCDEPNSRVLRIEGGPGLGKTALASYLAHSTKSSVLAVHLCQYNKGESRNPLRLVRTLAYQLATRLPDYRARLLKSVAIQRPESMQGKDAASLWGELIASPLAGGGKGNIDRQRLAIIIDGLDEATVEGKNPIVELLAADINQLPKWIGVVLTGRPDPELTQRLARYHPTVLRDDDPQNIADLKVYVDDWLAQEVKAGTLSTTQATAASKALLEKSQGAFLYLSQARIAVAENMLDLSQPDQFPSGLGEIYQRFFERRFSDVWSDESSFQTKVRPLLELVLASPEPLPIAIAKDILKWGPYDGPAVLKSLGSLLKRAKGGLAGEDEETLAPFHNSVREWLQDADVAGDFYVNAEAARYPLTAVVWNRYLVVEGKDAYGIQVLPSLVVRLTKTDQLNLWPSVSLEEELVLVALIDQDNYQYFEEKVHKGTLVGVLLNYCKRLVLLEPENPWYQRALSAAYLRNPGLNDGIEAQLSNYEKCLEIRLRLCHAGFLDVAFVIDLVEVYAKLASLQSIDYPWGQPVLNIPKALECWRSAVRQLSLLEFSTLKEDGDIDRLFSVYCSLLHAPGDIGIPPSDIEQLLIYFFKTVRFPDDAQRAANRLKGIVTCLNYASDYLRSGKHWYFSFESSPRRALELSLKSLEIFNSVVSERQLDIDPSVPEFRVFGPIFYRYIQLEEFETCALQISSSLSYFFSQHVLTNAALESCCRIAWTYYEVVQESIVHQEWAKAIAIRNLALCAIDAAPESFRRIANVQTLRSDLDIQIGVGLRTCFGCFDGKITIPASLGHSLSIRKEDIEIASKQNFTDSEYLTHSWKFAGDVARHGKKLRDSGRIEESLAICRIVLNIVWNLYRAVPSDGDFAKYLAEQFVQLGDLLSRLERIDQVQSYCQLGLRIAQDLRANPIEEHRKLSEVVMDACLQCCFMSVGNSDAPSFRKFSRRMRLWWTRVNLFRDEVELRQFLLEKVRRNEKH